MTFKMPSEAEMATCDTWERERLAGLHADWPKHVLTTLELLAEDWPRRAALQPVGRDRLRPPSGEANPRRR